MSFHLHISDSFAGGAAELMQTLAVKPAGDPLQPEVIVLQSGAMAERLAMELASSRGVFTAFRMPFPRRFITDLIESAGFEGRIMDRDSLLWSTMQILSKRQDIRDKLSGFMPDGPNLHARFSAAGLIAASIDDYCVMRPEIWDDWPESSDHDYQKEIYDLLISGDVEGLEPLFPLYSLSEFLDMAELPERISIFGVYYMVPVILRLLKHLSSRTEVHVFHLKQSGLEMKGEGLFVEPGLGESPDGFSFRRLMSGSSEVFTKLMLDAADQRMYLPPTPGLDDTVLHAFQRHVLGNIPPPAELRPVPENDISFAVSICHSRMRQVEVLYDYILDDLDNNPNRTLSDIAVLMPDVDEFAPYIDAVFGSSNIPYRVAGISAHNETPIKRGFNAIMSIPGSRWEVSRILDILDCPLIAQNLGLSGSDVDTIRGWLDGAGIRWGLSAAERAAKGLPEFDRNSWLWGLDRILMGFAAGEENFFDSILPFAELDPSQMDTLSALFTLFETMRRLHMLSFSPQTPRVWADGLREVVSSLFISGNSWEVGRRDAADIDDILGALDQLERGSDFYSGEIPFPVVREYIMLGETRRGNFLPGRVLFAPLLNMRGLPFDVVCILGMEDGSIPGSVTHSPFNIISENPRPGERDIRSEERGLFLDTVMSTGERLFLLYTGLSIRDNKKKAPSVFLQSLLDSLAELFSGVDESLVVKHPLHPFDNRYYEGGKLFTYTAPPGMEWENLSRPLFYMPPVQPTELEISPYEYANFWKNPARFFCQHVMGIETLREAEEIEDTEPMELNKLQEWQIGDEMLRRKLGGEEFDLDMDLLAARGQLPIKARSAVETIADRVTGIVDRMKGTYEQTFRFVHRVGPISVVGDLKLYCDRMRNIYIPYYSDKSDKYVAAGLIVHLLMNRYHGEYTTHLIFRNKPTAFQPMSGLETVDILFLAGLIRPLPFHPMLSADYYKKIDPEQSNTEEIWNALKWNDSGDFNYDLRLDEFQLLCYGGTKPIDDEFRQAFHDAAMTFWGLMGVSDEL